MIFRVSHRFTRVEAQGSFGGLGRANDPADPVSLQIQVTDSVNVSDVIETASTPRPTSGVPADPLNIISQLPEVAIPGMNGKLPYRASTGLWSYDLTPGLYQRGKQYNLSWRYEMTPGNLKVEHTSFVWNPPPMTARLPTQCLLSDSWFDMTGTPVPLHEVVVEQYQDTFALANRTDSVTIQTDIFGNWYIELTRGALVRFVLNDQIRTITVPDDYFAILSKIPDTQPTDVRKDRFGYPLP